MDEEVQCFTFEQDLEGLLWTGDLHLHTVHHVHTVTGVRPQNLGLGRPAHQSYTHEHSNNQDQGTQNKTFIYL